MTDAEIREQLHLQIKQGERTIEVSSPRDGSPLMLKFPGRLTPQDLANIRDSWEAGWVANKVGPKAIALDEGVQIFQLIDGRWQEL